jgi:predicted protein tyrosine phosphatase
MFLRSILKLFYHEKTQDLTLHETASESEEDQPVKYPDEICRYGNIVTASPFHVELATNHGVIILDEFSATRLLPPREDVVMIRISDCGLPPLESPNSYRHILECDFPDLESDYPYEITRSCWAYQRIERESLRIRDFISRHQDRFFVIHCAAGIARSAAVALYLLKMRGDEDGVNLIITHPELWKPNRWVLLALQDKK